MPEQPQPRPVLEVQQVQKLAMETAAKGAEAAASGPGLTAPEKAVAEIAAKNLSAGRAREAALTVTTGLKHTADADALEQRAFLSNVGPDGKRIAASPAEQGRADGIKQMREAYVKLLLDPSTLVQADIDVLKPQIEAMIAANAAQFPGLLEAYQAGGGAFDATLIQNLMKNPQVANLLAGEMNRIYDAAAAGLPKTAQIEEKTLQAQQDIVRITGEKSALVARKALIAAGPADETSFLTTAYSYIDHDGNTVNATSKAQAMRDIDHALAASGSTDPGITSYAKNVAELRGFEEQLQIPGLSATEKTTIRQEIQKRRQWVVQAENDPQYGRLCKVYSGLSAEQHDIETRIEQGKDGKTGPQLDADIQAKTNEIAAKQKTVEDLQLEKNTMVGDLESAMKNALAEACAQYITQEKNAVFENYPAYEKQARSELEERARQLMHQALQNRYFKMEAVPASLIDQAKSKLAGTGLGKFLGVDGRTVFRPVFDSATAIADIKAFTDPTFNPETFLKGVATTAGLTSDQADVLLRDPQFVKDHMTVATQRALRAYEWKNGMGPDTINGLVETDWGAAAVDYVIKQSGAAKDLAKDYAAEGGSISKSLKEKMGAGWLLKLLMFLMSVGASPFVMKKSDA